MNEKLINPTFAIAGMLSLLLLGLSANPLARMHPGIAASSLPTISPAALEKDVMEITSPADSTPPRHRRRAALSMPYFSFARSLRGS